MTGNTRPGARLTPHSTNMPMKKDKKVCCICGKEFTEYGNSPYPIKEGRNHLLAQLVEPRRALLFVHLPAQLSANVDFFIFISQADKAGKDPAGSVAKHIRYDADIKIKVEGYKAFVTTRYEDTERGEGGADQLRLCPGFCASTAGRVAR